MSVSEKQKKKFEQGPKKIYLFYFFFFSGLYDLVIVVLHVMPFIFFFVFNDN